MNSATPRQSKSIATLRAAVVAATVGIFLATALTIYTLFGSLPAREVVGERCGMEDVIPCVMHPITAEYNFLDRYRLYSVGFGLALTSVAIAAFVVLDRRLRRTINTSR